jgi:hypothetical protein
MTIEEITDLVNQAINAALALSWFKEYELWANAWLTERDRSHKSAHLARARVQQWINFGGGGHAIYALHDAADAAYQLAWASDNPPAWRLQQAQSRANQALHHATRAHELHQRPDPRPQDELVIRDEEFSPGPIVQKPNRYPRTIKRLD